MKVTAYQSTFHISHQHPLRNLLFLQLHLSPNFLPQAILPPLRYP